MKRIKLPIAFVAYFTLFLSACQSDFLEQKTLVNIYEEDVFTDSLNTLGIVNSMYNDIGFSFSSKRFSNGGYDIGTNDAETLKDVSQWYYFFMKGAINPSNINKDPWTIPYEKIRIANLFLKNKDLIPVTKRTLDYWEAQVRFLRAWFIFQQVKHYGGVPLIGDRIFTDQEEINLPRNTYAECVQYIVDECDAAAPNLPIEVDFNDVTYGGRVTRGAALALKARVLLYAASPLANCNRSDDPEHYVSFGEENIERWKEAYDAAKVLMDPQFKYGLYKVDEPYFYNLFLQSYPTEENIFSEWPQNTTQNKMLLETQSNPPSRGTRYAPSGPSSVFPTQHLVDAFPMLDGKSIEDKSGKYPYPGIGDDMYKNRDPRLAATVCYNGMPRPMEGFPNAVQWTYTGVVPAGDANVSSASKDGIYNSGATSTGYYRMKGMDKEIHSTGERYRPNILIRYAEILLNAAEAANEYESSPTQEIYEWLYQIRDRAGIEKGDGPEFYGIKNNMTKEEMRDFIHNERRIELAFEEHRYWDIRRWRALEKEGMMNYWTQGLEITRMADGTFEYRLIDVEERNNSEAQYWWPIPMSEITKSPALVQNPGY